MAKKPTKAELAKKARETLAAAAKHKLAGCACGKTPETLVVELTNNGKDGLVVGTCCGTWYVPFLNGFCSVPEETMGKARDAWNAAPRG